MGGGGDESLSLTPAILQDTATSRHVDNAGDSNLASYCTIQITPELRPPEPRQQDRLLLLG